VVVSEEGDHTDTTIRLRQLMRHALCDDSRQWYFFVEPIPYLPSV
jgi:hypothetical protein